MGRHARGTSGVASGHPQAAEAGMATLDAGGTAIDAALAAVFTQWVVNAPLCGCGGDLVALVVDGDDVTVYGGWSRVPRAIDTSAEPEPSGPRGAVVPGSLRGADAAWRAGGRRPWRELFAGALGAADGHVVTETMAAAYRLVETKGHGAAIPRVTDHERPPMAGDQLCTPQLAETLALVAEEGADALYSGPLADRLVAAAEEDGAWLRSDDLESIEAGVEPAVRVHLADITVWVTGAPSQAMITPALLAAVKSSVDPGTRGFGEAVSPITERMLVERCVQGLGGTAVSTAVDGAGRSATIVHSLAGTQFGTGWVAGSTGIALGNRTGTALSLRPELEAAHPRGGAVLPHTLSAAHVRGTGRWMTLATPGGDRQVQWLAQAIQRFRRGAAVEAIACGPRWFVCPEGDRFGVPAGIGQPWYAYAEPGIEWRDDDHLAGYEVKQVELVGGGLQVAVGNGDEPTVDLASDDRAGGAALARTASGGTTCT